MKCGDIIKVKNYVFLDGQVDNNDFERRCIVLFEDNDKVCVCPIISLLSSFNNNPNNYYLLPLVRKNRRNFSFAKLNSITFINKEDVISISDFLTNKCMIGIINKIKKNYLNYKNNEYYEEALNKIEEKIAVK